MSIEYGIYSNKKDMYLVTGICKNIADNQYTVIMDDIYSGERVCVSVKEFHNLGLELIKHEDGRAVSRHTVLNSMRFDKGVTILTKNGENYGNGIIYNHSKDGNNEIAYNIITDFGNKMSLSHREVATMFTAGPKVVIKDWLDARFGAYASSLV